MSNLLFKKGLYESLFGNGNDKAALDINNGTIYFTTDEGGMYVDIDNERRRVQGSVLYYETAQEFLKKTKPPYSSDVLYFIAKSVTTVDGKEVEELWNALLHWDKTSGQFVQINTTARDLQNLSTKVSNNTLAITDLKNVLGYDDNTDVSSVIVALQQKDANQDEKIATIEEKLESVATTEGLKELKTKVDNHDTALTEQKASITAIETKIGELPENSTIAGLISDLDSNKADKTTTDGLRTDLNGLTTTVNGHTTTIGQQGAAITEINGEIDGINVALETKASIDTVQALDTEVDGLAARVAEYKGLIDKNTADIGVNSAGINELNSKHTTLSGRVDVLEAAAPSYATKTDLADHNTRITELEEAMPTKAAQADLKALEGTVSAQGTAIEGLQANLNTKLDASTYNTDQEALSLDLKGIKDRITTNEEDIADLKETVKDIGTQGTAIESLTATVNGHTDAINTINETLDTKADQSALNEVVEDVSDLSNKLGAIPAGSDAYTLITNNSDAIADLVAADETISKDIVDLKAADVTINGEIDKLKAADVTMGQNISDLQNNKANLSDFNTLKTAVETIQDDYLTSTDKQNLLNKITSEINAANAMTYKGGIANSIAFDEVKASGTVSVGDTYVVTGAFGEFYAGDLIVFSSSNTEKPEQDNGYIATADLIWTRVDTGYIETHEATMSLTPVAATETTAESALLRLSSHTANEELTMGNLGKITIKGTENITVKASGDADNGYVLEIGMKWGSF